MIDTVRNIIKLISDFQEEVNVNTSLEDLCLDSFMFIQLIVDLENAYNIEFNEDDLQEGRFINVGDLIERMDQLIKG